ncbi:MAG: serine/threonine-protein phosphatase [Ignavibacteriae bacterium]|nr:serine/threonine-protein phosphatase [Ignavibacteriota bacterium]
MPLWKLLAGACGMAILFFFLWESLRLFLQQYIVGQGIDQWLPSMLGNILHIGIFVLPIALIGWVASRIVDQRKGSLSPTAERMLRGSLWLGSGVLGSLIAYETLTLLHHGQLDLPASVLTTTLTANTFIVLLGSALAALFGMRRRGKLLHNQEKLLTDEFRAAYKMQQSLLPETDARIYGYDISGGMQPAVEVGGDYYDYLSFADGSKGILVADASGKGMPAALIMAKFQGMAQALSIHVHDPHEFFVGLNDTLRLRLNRQTFITVGMMTIDFEDRCTFWRAGHNGLLHYAARTNEVIERKPPGIALGLTHGGQLGTAMQPEEFVMEKDDIVLLYSDGLVESENIEGEEFGEERLTETLKDIAHSTLSAGEIRKHILHVLSEFVKEAEEHDDITLVVLRRT